MRVAYYMSSNYGHFGEIYPYFRALGGLVISNFQSTREFFRTKYPEIPTIGDLKDLESYSPDVIIYATTQLIEGPWLNVQIFHGTSDKPFYFNFPEVMERYDLCLCYGQRQVDKFHRRNIPITSVITGCAKLEESVPYPGRLFEQDKPIILYAPSWQRYSSLKRFHSVIETLSEQFNVLVKPHPATGKAAAEGGEQCENYPFVQMLARSQSKTLRVVQLDNIIPLMHHADLFLGDIGGSIYEFLYFNKPAVALNPDPARFSASDDLLSETYLWNFLDVVHDPGKLIDAVKANLEDDHRSKSRKEIFSYSYYQNSETSALQRGIAAITKAYEEKRRAG